MTNNKGDEKKVLAALGILSSPVRLQILRMLKKSAVGSMGLRSIVDGMASNRRMSKSHVCEQLKVLERAGLVKKRQVGRTAWYSLVNQELSALDQVLGDMIDKISPTKGIKKGQS